MNFSKKFLRVVSMVLMILVLIPSMPSFAATFSDVKSTHWAYNYIEEMVKLKYINGYDDGTFKPKGTLTYLETLQLLSKLLTFTNAEVTQAKLSYTKVVTDLKVPTWAHDAVIKCLYKGVITEAELKSANSNGLLNVGTNKRVGRLDISIYMAKAMGLEDAANAKAFVSLTYKDLLKIDAKYHKLIYVLVEAGVLSKDGTGSGYFEPGSPLLREQMAKMLSTAYDYLQKSPPVIDPVPIPEPVVNTEKITGVITKITNLGANTFVSVKTKANTEAAYLVDAKTTIKLDARTTTIASLYEGQNVDVTITKGTSTAVMVEAKTVEEEITGTIKSLSPASNKLLVEYVKDKVTKTIELVVDKNTDITLNGTDADLYDLSTGDKVELLVENNLVIELEAIPQSGEVEGVIVDLTTETVSRETVNYVTVENSKGIKTEYELDKDVDIYRNGRRAVFGDLKIGDEAVLELEYGLVVDIDADVVEKEIEGSITAISTRLNVGTEVTINNRDTGKEETFLLSRNVTIKVDGVVANSFSLNVGYFVEVVVGSNEIIEIIADSAGAESMIRGIITDIDTRRDDIDLKIISSDISEYKYGDEITIKVNNDVVISEFGYYDLDIDDLADKMEVLIFGYYDGYSFIATEINIR